MELKHALRGRSDKMLAVLGILGLTLLPEKGLYRLSTDECLQTAQHSSTEGSINMQQHRPQRSPQRTKDNDTDTL